MRWPLTGLWILAALPGLVLILLSLLFFLGWDRQFLAWTWGLLEALGLARPNHTGQFLPGGRVSLSELIALGTLIVSTLGTISTVWLAWRNESRQAREDTLKIQQLEIQLAALRAANPRDTSPLPSEAKPAPSSG